MDRVRGGAAVAADPASRPWTLGFDVAGGGTLSVRLGGSWRLRDRLPSAAEFEQAVAERPGLSRVVFETREVSAWDSGLVNFALKVARAGAARGLSVDRTGLPEGAARLVALATTVPGTKTGTPSPPPGWLARVGLSAIAGGQAAHGTVRFVGEATLALARFVTGRAQFRRIDLVSVIQDCGPSALPIVTLISFLVGLILAFMGAVQLRTFGAQVYVADLVAVGATREMGALMTGIIMAGRTGAAFAAQLGTMQVNEEIDALVTMGIPPMDFLVLPRMAALILMMPLLVLYSDLLAIAGGAFVGVTMLDLGFLEYLQRTRAAMSASDVVIGLVKGAAFGVLVALSGCLRGMQSGRSAAAVGLAATSAVVTAIVLIVVAEGLFAVLLDALGL